jgi:hypothetical protein
LQICPLHPQKKSIHWISNVSMTIRKTYTNHICYTPWECAKNGPKRQYVCSQKWMKAPKLFCNSYYSFGSWSWVTSRRVQSIRMPMFLDGCPKDTAVTTDSISRMWQLRSVN